MFGRPHLFLILVKFLFIILTITVTQSSLFLFTIPITRWCGKMVQIQKNRPEFLYPMEGIGFFSEVRE